MVRASESVQEAVEPLPVTRSGTVLFPL
jgi:hypothetical protein